MPTRAFLFSADQKALDTISQILTELEISFEIVPDSASGLKRIGTQHFDFILVDCEGGQNVGQLFAAAKTSALNQGAVAIAIADGKNGVVNAFRLGASLVLSKPVSMDQARGTLRNALAVLRKATPETKPHAATPANLSQATVEAGTVTKPAPPPSSTPPAKSIAQPVANTSKIASVGAKPVTDSRKHDLHQPIPIAKTGGPKAAGISLLGEEPLGRHPAPPTFGMRDREKKQRRMSPLVLAVVAAALILAGVYGYATLNPKFYESLSTQFRNFEVMAHLASKPQPVAVAPKPLPTPVAPRVQAPPAAPAEAATAAAPADGFAEPQPAPAEGFQSNEPAKAAAAVIMNTSATAPKSESESAPAVVPEDVADSHVAYRVLPTYPETARRKGVKGSVVLNASIDKDGTVTALEVLSGNTSLASAATAAVKQWRYQIYYRNGQPAEFQTQITVQFPHP